MSSLTSDLGVCRPSLVDVVPVKNEEGVVIMFILDFQELRERSQRRSGLRQRVARGWIYCACHVTVSHDFQLPALKLLLDQCLCLCVQVRTGG